MSGDFYFMKDKFYSDFPNCGLMPNKESTSQNTGNRPCFFAFQDKENKQIFWFVPISSKSDEKYKRIYDKNIEKYGRCDFLDFGIVLGTRATFLIQNIFPVTKDYIDSRYVVDGVVVKTDNVTTHRVIQKANDVLEKSKRGIKLAFTDIDKIYSSLLEQIAEKEKMGSSAKTENIERIPKKLSEQEQRDEHKAEMPTLTSSDNSILKRISDSAKGAMFDSYFSGRSTIDKNQANHFVLRTLAFFSNFDKGAMERIFKNSKLYDGDNNKLNKSIGEVIAGFFSGSGSGSGAGSGVGKGRGNGGDNYR